MNIAVRAREVMETVGTRIKAAINRDRRRPGLRSDGLEGEGSYEGTRRYNAGVRKFVDAGAPTNAAKAASAALDGPEGKSLRDAEAAAKAGPPRPTSGRR